MIGVGEETTDVMSNATAMIAGAKEGTGMMIIAEEVMLTAITKIAINRTTMPQDHIVTDLRHGQEHIATICRDMSTSRNTIPFMMPTAGATPTGAVTTGYSLLQYPHSW